MGGATTVYAGATSAAAVVPRASVRDAMDVITHPSARQGRPHKLPNTTHSQSQTTHRRSSTHPLPHTSRFPRLVPFIPSREKPCCYKPLALLCTTHPILRCRSKSVSSLTAAAKSRTSPSGWHWSPQRSSYSQLPLLGPAANKRRYVQL